MRLLFCEKWKCFGGEVEEAFYPAQEVAASLALRVESEKGQCTVSSLPYRHYSQHHSSFSSASLIVLLRV
jgi:hypothetical protein